MPFPRTIFRFVAMAAVPLGLGLGAAFSAPSLVSVDRMVVSDEAFEPSNDGVDYAAVTGPRPDKGAVPACADPARRGDLPAC
ncbi:hypothetical protein [Mesorhizobium sp. CAU 1741]|uniref:hypothetical protein n=1 Tax=Mesorhizobium sp. CAU 1741 TaxID=3140366 RepID=UPI00325B6AB6